MRKPTAKDWIITAVFVAMVIVGLTAVMGGSDSTEAAPTPTSTLPPVKVVPYEEPLSLSDKVRKNIEKIEKEEAKKKADEALKDFEESVETVAQQNAREKAEDYLQFSAFSRKGLIDQLRFEDYSTKDATYAVDHIDVNWNKQAALKAEDYLKTSSFSRQGLIEQLEFEGFTHKQAVHGVRTTGL